jgi:hypothetical protein
MLAVGAHRGGRSREALRWLGAPATLLALAVLALNDHVLKHAAPGVVTGKLSDVAGLVVAPPLLAVGLALLRAPRPTQVSLVATGIGFTLAKTTEWGIDAANAVWSLVWPTEMLRDPTDLVALPALLLAAWVARAVRRPTSPGHRSLGLALGSLALPFAVVATAATSPCHTPEGLRHVGVVRGDYSGPPSGAEDRLIVSLSHRSVSIDAGGRLSHLSGVDEPRVPDTGPALDEVCSAAAPRQCWRRSPGTREPRVDASTDGGATWTTAYRMPAAELEQVREAAGETCGDEPVPVAPRDLSVLDTPRGPWVAVASGQAGLLLRDPDGTWNRLTDQELSRRAGAPPTPDPDELFTPLDPTPTRPSRTTPSSRPTQPTPPAQPTTPCASRTVVTVTPHPSNGTPFPRETCLTSPYS